MTKSKAEYIVSSYMKALGDEKISVNTWKRISKVNGKILEEVEYYSDGKQLKT